MRRVSVERSVQQDCKGVLYVQDEWYRRAELALTKGDEELAREALSRKKSNQVP